MPFHFSLAKGQRGALPALFLALALCLPLTKVHAVSDTFYNGDNIYANTYNNGVIQATNFINDGNFSVSTLQSFSSWKASLYHGWQYARNFTNTGNGVMTSDGGFNFDLTIPAQNVTDQETTSFYNAGSINCGANNGFYFLYYPGLYFFGYGGINISATNIYHAGSIAIGVDGFAKLAGDSINFDGGTLALNTASQYSSQLSSVRYSWPYALASGQVDTSTNKWHPDADLGLSYAFAVLNSNPYFVDLGNTQPYFQVIQRNATNVLVRMVFFQDNSPGVNSSVYIVGNDNSGGFHIEWAASNTDPVTGSTTPQYLYLDSDPGVLSQTNIFDYGNPGNGIPGSFQLYPTTTQRGLGGAQPVQYPYNLMHAGAVVTNNPYAYFNAQMVPSDVPLNEMLGSSPNLLPGRVEISAAKNLNFNQASITGMNYLLLNSTNEFDADQQSEFAASYSDLYLGHTNGNMTITNLMTSQLPVWNGSVQAYCTRWFYTDTNHSLLYTVGTNVVTYEYRVLIVGSQLTPYTAPRQGNVKLYASNNVVISDALNISSNLFLNCTNLLITTNGAGAYYANGQLNLSSQTLSWQAATPRLNNLVNNGQINLGYTGINTFGTGLAPYTALINGGSIFNFAGATMNAGDFENYGTISSGSGKLIIQSATTTMSNAVISVGTAFSNAATTMVISGTSVQAGQSLTLAASSQLTDTGVTNGNLWVVGANNIASSPTGIVLPVKPATGDLLGTTIHIMGMTPASKTRNTWSAVDRGPTSTGYSNNVAVGQLILDGQATNSQFIFMGTGASNAIYVDCLQLNNYASYAYHKSLTLPSLIVSNNIVIYYAQALSDGMSVADKINHFNNDHIRWVPSYAGQYSSTTLVYPDGSTNVVNAALAASDQIDSNGNGIENNADPAPIFVPSQVHFSMVPTNVPPQFMMLQWSTVPLATNYVEYTTNINQTGWMPLTNFANYYYGAGVAVTNAAHVNWFVSPQAYPNPATNVWVLDPISGVSRFYRVCVKTWLTYPN